MLKYDFSKRLTVITGGASGIGRGIALAFAENASDLAIMDINQEAGGELALELTKKFNIRASFYKCNVADFEETQAAGAKIISDYNLAKNSYWKDYNLNDAFIKYKKETYKKLSTYVKSEKLQDFLN